MDVMKRAHTIKKANGAKVMAKPEKKPKTYDPKGLRESAGFLRMLLAEIDGFAKALEDGGIETITLEVGRGAESYDLTEKALNAWIRGVRQAVLNERRPKNGG